MDWNVLLQNLLYVVITGVVPILATFLVKFIKTKIEEKIQVIDNTYVKETITEATTIITNCVQSVTQTYVDNMKKLGTFTVAEQKIALDKALTQAKELLTTDAVNLIADKYTDLDAFITTIIEAYIQSTKTK